MSQRRNRILILALALFMAALACNLTGGDSGGNNPQVINPPFTPAPTQPFVIPTSTPLPTPTLNLPTPTATAIPCNPITTWPIYIVREGDVLSAIATATGATVEQLVIANCLASADTIFAGQQLYVPRLPVLPTPRPPATNDPNAPSFTQALSVDKHWINPSGRPVTYYSTVRVDVGPVWNADRVDFFVNDPFGNSAIFIGQDTNPWDGAFYDYNFPTPGEYTFMTTAENESKRINSNVFTIVYDPNYVPPEGRYNVLDIWPRAAFDGNRYTLASGVNVTISWPSAPRTAAEVDFTLRSSGAGGLPQSIGADMNPSDGASMFWTVPLGVSGQVQATAQMPDGTLIASQTMQVVAQ